ncbi:hypothetical protein JB92DRAFT_3130193 [Gautieria morchelliformis]|nr:hypothetical protein JB92DRAFT_3130193 [Gautieria morchelliformis]
MHSDSHFSEAQLGNVALALPRRELPFETWRPIFQIVYTTKNSISHPASDFEISNLNSRLNIYRCLAQVSRSWRANARDVFFEELEALTSDALKGIIRTFQNERHLALAVSRITFCFSEFRCTASIPRRPRPLRHAAQLDAAEARGQGVSSSTHSIRPNWKTVHRRDARLYHPSKTAQGSHWTRWQADVGQILAMCTSLSAVKIIFTNEASYVSARRYEAWFPPPDMTNENILNGLLRSPNLRTLHLVDPMPLERYGPALASWDRLNSCTIILTRPFEELQNTAFVPPKSLVSFHFHDRSKGHIPWPLASDLARCSDLQVLDLAVTSLNDTETTSKAIGFLCKSYQHSLRELTLHMIHGHGNFQDTLASVAPLHFPKLQRFRLPEAAYDTSVFSYFTADELKYVEVGWLMLEPTTGSREDKWGQAFSHSSLKMLEELVINHDDPDNLRQQAMNTVCGRLGIKLIFRPCNIEALEAEGEEADFDVVDM